LYIAQVKALLQDARDLIKFLPQTAGVTAEVREQVAQLLDRIRQVDREILR